MHLAHVLASTSTSVCLVVTATFSSLKGISSRAEGTAWRKDKQTKLVWNAAQGRQPQSPKWN